MHKRDIRNYTKRIKRAIARRNDQKVDQLTNRVMILLEEQKQVNDFMAGIGWMESVQ